MNVSERLKEKWNEFTFNFFFALPSFIMAYSLALFIAEFSYLQSFVLAYLWFFSNIQFEANRDRIVKLEKHLKDKEHA
jgi:hypothetical protein